MRAYFIPRDGSQGLASIQAPPDQIEEAIGALGPGWVQISGIRAFGAWMREKRFSYLDLLAILFITATARLIMETIT